MAKHTINGCIAYRTKSYWADHERFTFYSFVPSQDDDDDIFVMPHSIEFEVPDDFDPRGPMVANAELRGRPLADGPA